MVDTDWPRMTSILQGPIASGNVCCPRFAHVHQGRIGP